MEQQVENAFRTVCSACLSGDRNLYALNGLACQIFRLLMYDFENKFSNILEMEHLVCWECLAVLKRCGRFKQQVHIAQEHLGELALARQDPLMTPEQAFIIPQTLSALNVASKADYDKIYFDYTTEWPQYITVSAAEEVKDEVYDVAQVVRDNMSIDIDHHLLEVPQIVLENPVTGVMSHLVVGDDAVVDDSDTGADFDDMKHDITTHSLTSEKLDSVIISTTELQSEKESQMKLGYITEFMSESEMQASREEAKQKLQYASAVYKCELCIIGFYTQHQVEDHFVTAHRTKPGLEACKVCYMYVPENKLQNHLDSHYIRYICKMCNHVEFSTKLIGLHVKTHTTKAPPKACIRMSGGGPGEKGKKKKKSGVSAKPGDLRKLLSKTTIEGYQCLECDMFFKNSRARKNHVARCHREGLQCDVCKKRFVNKTTLATHLRLHEGPLPRQECPICHKMVRVVQLKYHIQRHNNKTQHECVECNKVFSHLATYQAHLKYSRAHASDHVFKYPCPMCNKGYPTKEQMQDHFNYQHLGRTAHKCPICDKPIASRANVDKHMMRVHGEKKEKPRNHRCQQCGKTFTDKKALTQHEVIHSGERPLSCEVCQQTFKQKASLYTHRKRVHKIFPAKRSVQFMDAKPQDAS